ncbi:hypothetical protein F0562_010779 [Nyssa sinensis]|uniref:Uncharacterized protein n=1 Tax=Nyssa sinensis TaxID=561372 RepID=A0A5J5A2Q5_9ASTE|nr:hypothetical protein F0562_010779 [Nyssa sinensis]
MASTTSTLPGSLRTWATSRTANNFNGGSIAVVLLFRGGGGGGSGATGVLTVGFFGRLTFSCHLKVVVSVVGGEEVVVGTSGFNGAL